MWEADNIEAGEARYKRFEMEEHHKAVLEELKNGDRTCPQLIKVTGMGSEQTWRSLGSMRRAGLLWSYDVVDGAIPSRKSKSHESRTHFYTLKRAMSGRVLRKDINWSAIAEAEAKDLQAIRGER